MAEGARWFRGRLRRHLDHRGALLPLAPSHQERHRERGRKQRNTDPERNKRGFGDDLLVEFHRCRQVTLGFLRVDPEFQQFSERGIGCDCVRREGDTFYFSASHLPGMRYTTVVLQLVAEGMGNKQMAADLGISIKTVEKHRQQVMNKLGDIRGRFESQKMYRYKLDVDQEPFKAGDVVAEGFTDYGRLLAFQSFRAIPPSGGEPVAISGGDVSVEVVDNPNYNPDIEVNIIGFAQLLSDVIQGLLGVFVFFGLAFLITMALLYGYSRSLRLTVVFLFLSVILVFIGTIAQVEEADAGFWFTPDDGQSFPYRGRGVRIPRLEDLLRQDLSGRGLFLRLAWGHLYNDTG